MRKKVELKESKVYLPKNRDAARDSHRRIVGIIGNTILYSNGGDHNYSCKRTSFLAWCRKKMGAA